MIDLPIKFDQLVNMPGDAGGTGYPYRISAKDLMANFEYAALDGDDSWIDTSGQGRRLVNKDDFLKDLQDQIDALVDRLDTANITAQCANGNVEVTLNI